MVFVGRERETAHIVGELSARSNVIVTGKYGVGRTSLIRHVAEVMRERRRFLFVDFSQTSAKVCFDLLGKIRPSKATTLDLRRLSYKSARARVLRAEPADARRHVLVLDNLGAVTASKLSLVRRLASTRRYQFIAITDSETGPTDLLHLRESLYPVCLLGLRRLPRRASREFFEIVARDLGLVWGEGEIAGSRALWVGIPS
jgi:hypothetical protein